jgi:hypothetical protein
MFAGGTLPQKVSSCLEVLDGFMKQPYPVVASMVVADKTAGSGGSDNLTTCVASIMGMSDITRRSKICLQLMPELFCKVVLCAYNPYSKVAFFFPPHIQAEREDLAYYTLFFYLRT